MRDSLGKSPTGADLLAVEGDEVMRARILSKLQQAHAKIELELANCASRTIRPIESRLLQLEEKIK